jgi:hypothetical protein
VLFNQVLADYGRVGASIVHFHLHGDVDGVLEIYVPVTYSE